MPNTYSFHFQSSLGGSECGKSIRRVGTSIHVKAMVFFYKKISENPSLGANLVNSRYLKKNIKPKTVFHINVEI